MSPTPPLKSSGLPRYNELVSNQLMLKNLFLKISNLLRFENGFDIRNSASLFEQKCPPHHLKFAPQIGILMTLPLIQRIKNQLVV